MVAGGDDTKTQDAVAQLLQEALETEMEHDATEDVESTRHPFLSSHRSPSFSSSVFCQCGLNADSNNNDNNGNNDNNNNNSHFYSAVSRRPESADCTL